MAGPIRSVIRPDADILESCDRQRNDLRRSISEMKRHAVGCVGNGVDALALGQVGVEGYNALVDIMKIAINLRRAVRRAGASPPCASRDVDNRHGVTFSSFRTMMFFLLTSIFFAS